MESGREIQKKFENLILFFVIYTILFLTFFSTIKYTLPFVLAFCFALILKYPTRFLMNKLKMKNWLASLICTVIFFSIFIFLIVLLIISLTSEIIKLTNYLQHLLTNNSSVLIEYIDKIQKSIQNLNIDIDPSTWKALENTFSSSLKAFLNGAITATSSMLQGLLTFLGYVPYVVMTIVFTLMSTYFFTKEVASKSSKRFVEKILPRGSEKVFQVVFHAKKMLVNYCLSYMFLLSVSMIITFIGFSLLKVEYALVLSIVAGLLDLLPIVGMFMIYFPIAIIGYNSGNYFLAISIVALYILVSIVRQILEPKVVSSSLGINPVATLAALFIGLQLGGIGGVVFCIFLVVTYNILIKVDVL